MTWSVTTTSTISKKGEENRDGHHSEFSFNYGIEGPTLDAEVLELRRRKIRLMHFLLQVSNGIPMILAGDEMLRTQLGNNNAYCHDSPLTLSLIHISEPTRPY